jgi:hypothetical protein
VKGGVERRRSLRAAHRAADHRDDLLPIGEGGGRAFVGGGPLRGAGLGVADGVRVPRALELDPGQLREGLIGERIVAVEKALIRGAGALSAAV